MWNQKNYNCFFVLSLYHWLRQNFLTKNGTLIFFRSQYCEYCCSNLHKHHLAITLLTLSVFTVISNTLLTLSVFTKIAVALLFHTLLMANQCEVAMTSVIANISSLMAIWCHTWYWVFYPWRCKRSKIMQKILLRARFCDYGIMQ